jgi:mannosyltransferase OCH1-like enzyme
MQKKHIWGVALIFAVCAAWFFMDQGSEDKQSLIKFYVDFDESMQLHNYAQQLENPVHKQWYTAFKRVYENNHPEKMLPVRKSKPKIPKIIHQIWLGSPFPEKYRAYQASWKTHHPDWEYRLWTDKELAHFPMRNRALFDASINYGEKSDIARYEILHKMGGVYVDTDYECLQPLDILNHSYDFFIGIQPLDTHYVQLGIGLIGSRPGHQLLTFCIEHMQENCLQQQQIIARTGPLYFSKVFEYLAPRLRDATVALPASFFYPRYYNQTAEERDDWICPESFAVHHWEASWLKPEAFSVPVEQLMKEKK